MKPDGRGVTVVGDDAQAIYSFRAARVGNILAFPAPLRSARRGRDARAELPVDRADPRRGERGHRAGAANATRRNCRATRARRRAAGARHRRRRARRRSTTSSSGSWSGARRACRCASRRCCSATAHHSDALEVELGRRNIPFVKFGGLRFLEAAHVKDALACLRWAENPRDSLAGFRVAQLLPGMGPRLADALVRHVAGGALRAAARARQLRSARRGARRLARVRRAVRAPHRRGRAVGRPAWAWCAAGTSRTLARIYDDARARLADIEQLEQLAAAAPSRERFLSDLTLDPPAGDRRRGGRASPRRGLPDPLDDPLGEGAGMGQRVRASTPPTAASRRTWRPARPPRSRRSAACCTSR